MARSKGMVQAVLVHEMIHMFDSCRHELDFKNVHHLACTEIRAANLTHCSFLSAMAQVFCNSLRYFSLHALTVYVLAGRCFPFQNQATTRRVRQD